MTATAILLGLLAAPFLYLALLLVPRPPSPPPPGALPCVLIPAFIAPSPLPSSPVHHSSSCPLVLVGIDIDQAENGSLNLPGRLFECNGRSLFKIMGLESYNHFAPGALSFRQKLNYLLLDNGLSRSQFSRAWMVTLPSLLGFAKSSPMTLWYVYGKDKRLCCVVLEVLNTVGPPDVYVLPTTSHKATSPRDGYHHAWLFPRAFQWSQCTLRNGFYRLDLVDPFLPCTAESKNAIHVDMRLQRLSSDKQVEWAATVASHPTHQAVPLDPSHCAQIVFALFEWSMAILRSTPRFLYSTYVLPVYRHITTVPQQKLDTAAWNASQRQRYESSIHLRWQEITGAEEWSEDYVVKWARKRAKGIGVCLHIYFTCTNRREAIRIEPAATGLPTLYIQTADPSFFVSLLVQPSALHYTVLAPELLTEISNRDLFLEFFKAGEDYTYTGVSPIEADGSLDHRIVAKRFDHFAWYVSHSNVPPTPALWTAIPPHFLGWVPTYDACKISQIIGQAHFMSVLEERMMHYSSMRFIEGREPWKIWERALRAEYVRRPPRPTRKTEPIDQKRGDTFTVSYLKQAVRL